MKVKRQRDFKDCGVTCLSYILEYYKGYVPIETLREDTFTDSSGVSAFHLIETLKKYGFHSQGKRVTIEKLKEEAPPFIAHVILKNGMQHFIVVTDIKKEMIVTMDPALGKKKYSYKEFLDIWDGVIITSIPIRDIPKLEKKNNSFGEIKTYLIQEKKDMGILLLLQCIVVFLSVISSLFIKFSLGVKSIALLKWCILLFFTFLLGKMICSWKYQLWKEKTGKHLEYTMLKRYLNHCFNISYSRFTTYSEGELLTRVEEVKESKDSIISILIPFILNLLYILVVIPFLFMIQPVLCVILIIGLVLYLGLGFVCGKKVYNIAMNFIQENSLWKDNVLEVIQMMSTIKHIPIISYYKDKMKRNLKRNIKNTAKAELHYSFLEWLKSCFLELLLFFLSAYGVYSIFQGTLTMVDFMVFENLYFYLATPFKDLVEVIPRWYYFKRIIEKNSEFLSIPSEKRMGLTNIKNNKITFSNVSYLLQNVYPVFKNISFTIKDREHIYLKGKSGVGKSTICKMIIGEIKNYQGSITLGGHSLEKYSISTLRRYISYLGQKENVFPGTIKENILLGRKVSEEKFTKVCEICHVKEIANKKTLQYETPIQIDTVSGGERQKIMLARTLLQDSKIVILDECLSEIDIFEEMQILKGIHEYLTNKTLIYITHRSENTILNKTIYITSSDVKVMKGGDNKSDI